MIYIGNSKSCRHLRSAKCRQDANQMEMKRFMITGFSETVICAHFDKVQTALETLCFSLLLGCCLPFYDAHMATVSGVTTIPKSEQQGE